MANEKDMEGYVTRGELREELASFKVELKAELFAMEQRLVQQLAQHANAILERGRVELAVVDDQYKALPGRVQRLDENNQALAERVQKLEDSAPRPKRPRRAAR